jgi:hypothetical protein
MTEERIDEVEGDGGATEVSDELLKMFKDELDTLHTDATQFVAERRDQAENTRFCLWDGQSEDGKKHAEDMDDGKEPFPFEGASDMRIRLADFVVIFRSIMLVQAALRAQLQVRGSDWTDERMAGMVQKIVKWCLTRWAQNWRTELVKVAQWMEGDSPGAAVMRVYWHQETAMENVNVSLEDVARAIEALSGEAMDEERAAGLMDMIRDPQRSEDAAALLHGLLGGAVDPQRARAMVRDLRRAGVAKFPRSRVVRNEPCVAARRLFEDTFFPRNTRHYQKARAHFDREWLTKPELEERAKVYGWSDSFVAKVLEHEAVTAFPETWAKRVTETGRAGFSESEEFKGYFEIIYAYTMATTDKGDLGIFVLTFHHLVDEPAKARELLDYPGGKYPGVFFARETLTNVLWDTRGCPEIIATHQTALKVGHDSFNDHAQFTLPPLRVPARRARMEIVLRPLGQIPEQRPNEIGWMELPEYPKTNVENRKEILRQVYEYFGLPHPEVAPQMTQLIQQDAVDGFLDAVKEVVVQAAGLCGKFLTDAQIEQIVGLKDMDVGEIRAAIAGGYDLRMTFDARDLDMNYLQNLAKVLKEMIIPLDTQQTIKRDRLINRLFTAIDPAMAEDLLQPVEAAAQREVEDEELAFAKIGAGVEPPLLEDGQNFALRLQWNERQARSNPESVQKMTPMSQEIWQKRIAHFQFMAQQEQNKMIGRIGVRPALSEG